MQPTDAQPPSSRNIKLTETIGRDFLQRDIGSFPLNPIQISIVTAVYNGEKFIRHTLDSVAQQDYPHVQHVVVDGASKDCTVSILESYPSSRLQWTSNPDRGIYDALNNGIRQSNGQIVGLLHSDDFFFSNHTLSRVAEAFQDETVDVVFGDLVYVDEKDPLRIRRFWKAGKFQRDKLRWGWMPPHPTIYVRRKVLETLGDYRLDCGTSADYEWILRLFYFNKLHIAYVPHVLVAMRTGGVSNASLTNRLQANYHDQQAWINNGLAPPWGLRFFKPLRKIPQYFRRPRQPPA